MSSVPQFKVGDQVILGEHQEIDINGKPCTKNWTTDMGLYVGKKATIISLPRTDTSGFHIYHVDIDGGIWFWRGVNMTLVSSSAETKTSPTISSGAWCTKCREFYPYAETKPDFICYGCKH